MSVADVVLTDSSSILPFVQKVFFNSTPTKDYNNLGTYGSPMTTTFPWATAIPKA